MLVRGQRLALLSVLAESTSASSPDVPVRWSLPPAVVAAPIADRRGLVLTESRRRGLAQVLPIGLPCLAYSTDRGRFEVAGRELVLCHTSCGRRSWLPLLVSWDPARHRKTIRWRVLTVSQRLRVVRPDQAFAARVSWGRGETYVVYRSLGPPAPRAFLGHHTKARFLFGQFTRDGTVKPIITVD
jgi:hypothetical protein